MSPMSAFSSSITTQLLATLQQYSSLFTTFCLFFYLIVNFAANFVTSSRQQPTACTLSGNKPNRARFQPIYLSSHCQSISRTINSLLHLFVVVVLTGLILQGPHCQCQPSVTYHRQYHQYQPYQQSFSRHNGSTQSYRPHYDNHRFSSHFNGRPFVTANSSTRTGSFYSSSINIPDTINANTDNFQNERAAIPHAENDNRSSPDHRIVKPLILIEKLPSSSSSTTLHSVARLRLVFDIEPATGSHSTTLSLPFTRLFVLSLEGKQLARPTIDSTANVTSQQQHFNTFISPHFVVSRQELEDDSDDHLTVETRSTNHSDFYSDNLDDVIANQFNFPPLSARHHSHNHHQHPNSAANPHPIRTNVNSNGICFLHRHDPKVSNPSDEDTKQSNLYQIFAGKVTQNYAALEVKPKNRTHNEHKLENSQVDISTSATFSITATGKLNGIITWHPYGQLLIEPIDLNCKLSQFNANNSIDPNSPLSHLKLDKSDRNLKIFQTCSHRLRLLPIQKKVAKQFKQPTNRSKRSYSFERNVEIMVVTDSTMYKYHGDSLGKYVLTLMAIVSHIFEHSSIGNEINIKLVRHTSLIDEIQEQRMFGLAQSTLRRFCRWQFQQNYESDDHPFHHDTAILLTRRDLCRNEGHIHYDDANNIAHSQQQTSCDTLGLAHSGQICDPESSCAIVEDNGLSAAFTIAHELGHVLGIPHDEEDKCENYYNTTEGKIERTNQKHKESNVMARMIHFTKQMWSWSPCSKHFITEYLDSGHGNCLLDNNSNDALNSSFDADRMMSMDPRNPRRFTHSLPDLSYFFNRTGMMYNASEQCRLVFGKGYRICNDFPFCRRLWCKTESDGCRTQHMPWADGTFCGEGYWCQQAECILRNSTDMDSVDGGWGHWSHYSKCTLNCGGGIQRSKRECNNPKPKNGGKFCLGERIRYQSCNTHQCSPPTPNIREQQCSKFDGKNNKKFGVQTDVTWVPHYTGIGQSDVCKLYCADSRTGEYYLLNQRVVDGTPCSPDKHGLCVNGKCLDAGCDNILGSGVHPDWCGVCGGDNSTCQEISGQYKPRWVTHGYNFVVSIPVGATNIEIHKYGTLEENWLAMLEDNNSTSLLNGNFTVNVYDRKWHYGGTIIQYSGIISYGYERINTTRPIERALNIYALCVGKLTVPTISYRWAVSLASANSQVVKYKWVLDQQWSDCSRMCNGEQQQKELCVDVLHQQQRGGNIRQFAVNGEFCADEKTRPASMSRVCNTACVLEWHANPNSKCSAKCGPGIRHIAVNCTRRSIHGRNKLHYIDDSNCAHIGPKPKDSESCTGSECRINYQWRYSDWSLCSVADTCGQGQQNRAAQCISVTYYDNFDNTVNDNSNMEESNVEHELCLKYLSEPVTIQTCSIECAQWSVSTWSECSVPCGQGERTRAVICMHGQRQVNDLYCTAIKPKPEEKVDCNQPECTASSLSEDLLYSLNQRQNSTGNFRTDLESNPATNNDRLLQPSHSSSLYQDKYLSTQRRTFNLNSAISNEHIQHNGGYHGTWQVGQWSTCNDTYKHLKLIQEELLRQFVVPDCFNSTDETAMFQSKFNFLFKLNETLASKSNSLQNLDDKLFSDESILFRRRYVACILIHSQQNVLPDNDCDPSTKPIKEEYCPLSYDYFLQMPTFSAQYCNYTNNEPSTNILGTTSLVDTSNFAESVHKTNEILPNMVDNPMFSSSYNNGQFSLEKIDWRLGSWSECHCNVERNEFVRERLVRCVRHFPVFSVYQNQEIDDGHCHKPKPDEYELCTTDQNQGHNCGHSAAANVQTYSTDDSPNYNSTISELANSPHHFSSPIYPSYYSGLSTTLPTVTPALSAETTSQNLTYLSFSLRPTLYSKKNTESSLYNSNEIANRQHYSSPTSDNNNYQDSSTQYLSTPLVPSTLTSESVYVPYTEVTPPTPLLTSDEWHDNNPNSNHVYGHWTEWSDWSECSVTCGNGTEMREPICPADQHCDEQLKPPIEFRPCFKLCEIFKWSYSEWSTCSAKCGYGVRTRTVTCQDWTKTTVPIRFCTGIKPETIEKCHFADCKLAWRAGHWSECSKSCSTGIQTRAVTCHRINDHGFVDPIPLSYPNLSLMRRKRKHRRDARKKRSQNRHIRINKPTNRSQITEDRYRKTQKMRHQRHSKKPNKNAEKFRHSRYAGDMNRIKIPKPQWCNLKNKPAENRFCNLGQCLGAGQSDAYVWKPLQWEPCPLACGDGFQQRKIQCHSQRKGTRVSHSKCDPRLRPERRRRCKLRECNVISCQDMRDRSRVLKDGEFTLWIQGAQIRVYCLGMNSLTKPLEYLILDSSVYDDNYSQMILKQDGCSSIQSDSLERSSILYFKHVRLNVTSLQIMTNDTMFSTLSNTTRNANRYSDLNTLSNSVLMGFGQAVLQGCPVDQRHDTNSIRECNFVHSPARQALFSINLQKTGLIVEPDSMWTKIGPENGELIEKNIKRSRKGDKIVGYCGFKQSTKSDSELIPFWNHCQIGCQPNNNLIQLQVP